MNLLQKIVCRAYADIQDCNDCIAKTDTKKFRVQIIFTNKIRETEIEHKN